MEDLRPSQASPEQIRQLVDMVGGILSGQIGERRRWLLLSIQRSLQQFHLDSQLEAGDVLIEAYLRTQTQIEAGTPIRNIPAWLNRVSYNIIREKSREKGRDNRLIDRLKPSTAKHMGHTYGDVEDFEALFSALNQLEGSDLELLILRIVKGLSWREIANLSIQRGEDGKNPHVLQQKLRKRGERALKRLRKIFRSIRNQGE